MAKQISLLTPKLRRQAYIEALNNKNIPFVVCVGPAGTGKTMHACQIGANMLKNGDFKKIIITRPAVSVDEEHGFLPGTLEDKLDPWVRPLTEFLKESLQIKDTKTLISEGIIEIAPLAYMRGRTFRDSWVIADEMQNCTPNQMKMLMTRLGERSKVIINGDTEQSDLNKKDNGLLYLLNSINGYQGTLRHLEHIEFTASDIKRHAAVREILKIL